MTHELKRIVQAGRKAAERGQKTVLATVVALDGSSYRRPGVRMLILDDRTLVGAVSGGCVEKEIVRQADPVFQKGIPRVMTYDGRFRLGCEGILYILLEPFDIPDTTLEVFQQALEDRSSFALLSGFDKVEREEESFGTCLEMGRSLYPFRKGYKAEGAPAEFRDEMQPCFRLLILGAEHDAVQLSSYAALTGWEVTVVASPDEEKGKVDFPGADILLNVMPENLDPNIVDAQTAVVLMTHSYVKDLKFLLALQHTRPAYLGLLGPFTRREKLLHDFLERCPDCDPDFLEGIHGPAGLNIGGETPQEIAIAILAEILSVIRNQEPIPLRDKKGTIHQ